MSDQAICEAREAYDVIQASSIDQLSSKVGEYVEKIAKNYKNQEQITVALSGGSLPKVLGKGLLEKSKGIDFSKWHIFFADERYVPHDHPDSNLKSAKEHIFDIVPEINQAQVYGINYSLSLDDAAEAYEDKIREIVESTNPGDDFPRFDILFLGMGPDGKSFKISRVNAQLTFIQGHICSLFPGHSLLHESKKWIRPISDSPKLPSQRITMTLPLVNAAKHIVFISTGKSKADALAQAVEISESKLANPDDTVLPASRVRPKRGSVVWFVDDDAASRLPKL